ncbi:Tat pathway signal protein [Actinomadura sp. NBRC 104425]|nr:Tat pathway signal protein [Actinomadura sp. NBRC 104425]
MQPAMEPARNTRNHRLVAAIAEAGLSYTALAASVRAVAAENGAYLRTNSAAITHWVRGTPPQPATAAYLAEALSRRIGRLITPADLGLGSPEDIPAATGDPVADLAELGRMDVDRRGFLGNLVFRLPAAMAVPAPGHAALAPPLSERAQAAWRGGTIGIAEVHTVRDILAAFTRADERLGGRVGRSTIAEYLASDATAYLRGRFANQAVRDQMFAAVAELARLAGFKAHDAGHEGLAQRYYQHAWHLASTADDTHAAFILRLMAHQAIDLGHGRHCVDLAESALTTARGRVDSATLGQLHLAVARTRAARGDARAARRALTTSERCIAAAPTERPWWAGAMGDPSALLATHTAKALRALGDAAVDEHMWESIRRWNPTTHPRVRALNMCDLGELYAERGHIEPACEIWADALHLLHGVDSARAHNAVRAIRTALSPYRQRGITDATRVDAMAARWQQNSTR